MRKNRSIFPRPWGRCGVECTSRIPNFAHARNNQASTNAEPLSTYALAGTPRLASAGFQRHPQPDGVLTEPEPISTDQPAMIVEEGEQMGLSAPDLGAV